MLSNTQSEFSPPPSPPSPCSSWPANSSSPPSSPLIDPLFLDDALEEDPTRQAPSITVTDPLAASYNGKLRGTKRFGSSNSSIFQKRPRLERKISFPELTQPLAVLDVAPNREEDIWESAIERAFETGHREIELRGQNLTKIPARVMKDLSNMVILPGSSESGEDIRKNASLQVLPGRRIFTRIHTAPASTFAGSTSLDSQDIKSTLSSNSLLSTVRNPMTLFLGQNSIKKLPAEMWTLQNLTVLSLRNNDIRFLPPGISQLVNLQSLNIAYNKLEYLPSELMDMKSLTALMLFPNPFIPDPHLQTKTRSVSQTKRIGSRVPTLTELSLRSLFAKPARQWTPLSQPFKTVLEEIYPLPLPTGKMWRPLSAPLSRTLATCVPGSIVVDNNADPDDQSSHPGEVTGISSCPNPGHRRNIFIHHAEERYTWEDNIANIPIGGVAAMLWRGCQHGCLDFLGPPTETQETVPLPDISGDDEAQGREAGGDNEEVEMAEDLVLHSIEFTGHLDFDDE